MANLTITVDDDIIRRARIRALEQGTSVNALLRAYLEAWVGEQDTERVVQQILESSERSRSGSRGRTWTRDELHER